MKQRGDMEIPPGEESLAPAQIQVIYPSSKVKKFLVIILAGILGIFIAGSGTYMVFKLRQEAAVIVVVSNPPRVTKILLDNKVVGNTTPLVLSKVPPGFHFLTLVKEGYEGWVKTFKVSPGEVINIEAKLHPLTRHASSKVMIQGDTPHLNVFVNGIAVTSKFKEINLSSKPQKIYVFDTNTEKTWGLEIQSKGKGRLFIIPRLDLRESLLKIDSNPKSAEVYLIKEGKKQSLGITPLNVLVSGEENQTIQIIKKGYPIWEQNISPTPGKIRKIYAQLETDVISIPRREKKKIKKERIPPQITKRKEPPLQAEGFLSLNTTPWTKVFINGEDIGRHTPLRNYSLSPGEHKITCINNEFGIRETFFVVIRPNKTTTIIKNLTSKIPTPPR
jgi:hypothetical protein